MNARRSFIDVTETIASISRTSGTPASSNEKIAPKKKKKKKAKDNSDNMSTGISVSKSDVLMDQPNQPKVSPPVGASSGKRSVLLSNTKEMELNPQYQSKLLTVDMDFSTKGFQKASVEFSVRPTEYMQNTTLRHRCPWCGQIFTSAIRRQLHLMLYPKKKKSCNFTSEEIVNCMICQDSIVGKYFDIHACLYSLVRALEEISITDEPFKTEAPDYCLICNVYTGCRYTLMSHLIVMHFPYADETQCGYCGKKSSELVKHVKLHKSEVLFFSTNKIIELMHYTLASQKQEKQRYPNLFGCCISENVEDIKPTDILIYFFQPNSCLLCTNFIGDVKSLNNHILWDWHECNHKALRNINDQLFLQEGNFYCRFCQGIQNSMIGHVCDKYQKLIKEKDKQIPKTAFSVVKNCLICWNRNSSPVQLLSHIPVFHNFGAVSRCGICHERVNPHHTRIHDKTLYGEVDQFSSNENSR